MLLIAENVMTNLEAYLGDFVPIAAKTIHSADGQYLAAGEAKSLTDELSTRIVVGRVHGGGVNSGVVQAGGNTSSLDGIGEVAIGSIGCKVKLRSRTCNQRRPRWPRTAWH